MAPDSVSARLSWSRGPWQAQVSGVRLPAPERVTPYHADKLSASLAFTSDGESRSIAWLAAFGQKQGIQGSLEAYLVEAALKLTNRTTYFLRLESVAKDILDTRFHPGTFHRLRQSQVGKR